MSTIKQLEGAAPLAPPNKSAHDWLKNLPSQKPTKVVVVKKPK